MYTPITALNEYSVKITSGGQITIPKKLRKQLGVDVNQNIHLVIDQTKIFLKAPAKTLEAVFIMAKTKKSGKNLSDAQIRKIATKEYTKHLINKLKNH